MLLRPRAIDFKIIGFYLGKLIIGTAFFMLIPMIVALLAGEANPFFDFLISFLFCIIVGTALHIFCYTEKDPHWSHGMIVVSVSWFLAALFGALPLFLSGHFNSFLDAFFESMSGFTTTGLSLAQDLSHMAYAHNLWRHLIIFLGGQGIVVVVLSFFVRGASGALRLYMGEARDEKILPNIRQTTRLMWIISSVYLVLGTSVLTLIGFREGLPFWKALFHGACIFMTAFDTGGFSPHSNSIVYYHSVFFEIGTVIIMIFGALNFRLHYTLWMGDRKEIWRNFEVGLLFVSILAIFVIVAMGLSKGEVYSGTMTMFRKGFFQAISAHTTTGFTTIYSNQFLREWGGLSLFGIIFAMSLGGCVSSTTGGIKMLRVGIIIKAFMNDVKYYVSPESSIFYQKIHHIKNIVLSERQMRGACMITLAYITTYFIGGLVGMMCGYPFLDSFFESTSAAANAGLSCGITSAAMPAVLKICYMLQMWAGRLEFVSLFALVGFLFALIKGKS